MLPDRLPIACLYTAAPGRVNLLGEHVDYNGGPVLPAAIDRTVILAADPLPLPQIHLHAVDLDGKVIINLADLEQKVDADGSPLPDWALYPAGVAWALQQAGFTVGGLRGVYTSTIPIGSGLSSSAAVELAFCIAWQAFGGWQAAPMALAQASRRAENDYVGVQCGLMDQFACMHGLAGYVLYFNTATLQWKPVALPAGTSLVIADSGIRRSLADTGYNERRTACQEAVDILRTAFPDLKALAELTPQDFASRAHLLPEITGMRARHVVEECQRVRQGFSSLQNGDTAAFGKLMFASHESLRDLYKVSTPELDALVEAAAGLEGCLGAHLTGAGFGGCTVNLVQDGFAQDFMPALQAEYQRRTGRTAKVFQCRPSRGARVERVF